MWRALGPQHSKKNPVCFVPCCPNFSLSESSGEKLIPGKSPALSLPSVRSVAGRKRWRGSGFFCHHGRGKQAGTFLSALAASFARCRWWLVGWLQKMARDTARQEGKGGVSSVSPPPLFRCCWFGFVGGEEAGSAELAIRGQSSSNRRRRCSKRKLFIFPCVLFLQITVRCSCCRKRAPRAFPQLSPKCFVSVVFGFVARKRSPTFYSNDGAGKKPNGKS